jgi:hypothetical protein
MSSSPLYETSAQRYTEVGHLQLLAPGCSRVLDCRPQISGNAADVVDRRVTVTKESASGLYIRTGRCSRQPSACRPQTRDLGNLGDSVGVCQDWL